MASSRYQAESIVVVFFDDCWSLRRRNSKDDEDNLINFMVIWKVHFMPSDTAIKNPVLQADEEELAADEVEIHGELSARNKEDMNLTAVHESELDDLLTADTNIDELHNCEDFVVMNNKLWYQICIPIVKYIGITTK